MEEQPTDFIQKYLSSVLEFSNNLSCRPPSDEPPDVSAERTNAINNLNLPLSVPGITKTFKGMINTIAQFFLNYCR